MVQRNINKWDYFICLSLFLIPPTWQFFDIQGWLLGGSILFSLAFFIYIHDGMFRKITLSYPLCIWMILTAYHLVNAFNNKVPEINALDIIHGFKIYACLSLTAYWASINMKDASKMFLITFLCRCGLGLSLTLLFNKFGDLGRMTGFGGSATLVGQAAAVAGVFIVYYNIFKKRSIVINTLLFILPLLVVFYTQSRNSLAMLLFSILTTAIIILNKHKEISIPKTMMAILLFVLIFYSLSSAFMDM